MSPTLALWSFINWWIKPEQELNSKCLETLKIVLTVRKSTVLKEILYKKKCIYIYCLIKVNYYWSVNELISEFLIHGLVTNMHWER